MLPMGSPERPDIRKSGRVGQALLRLLMRRATVVAAERLSVDLHLITIEGQALRDISWVPGQVIQIAMGSAFRARAYTPLEWNPVAGRLCILGYAHGNGPGSAWVSDVRPGDECDIFGPRRSIDVRPLPGRLVLFGDETSLGLGHALSRQDRAQPLASRFEVGDVESSRAAVTQLALGDVLLLERAADGAHIADMEAMIAAHAAAGASFVLAGKATTIQRLRQALKRHAVPSARISTKAYWAPGKSGLD